MSVDLWALRREQQSCMQSHYLARWRARATQIRRLERMIMLQESSCLGDLRVLAFFFDHWIIGKYVSALESSSKSRQETLRACVSLVRRVTEQRLGRLILRRWATATIDAVDCAKRWAHLAVLTGNGATISHAVAAEASRSLPKSRHEMQACDDSLDDVSSRIVYLSLCPMQNKGFLQGEILAIRSALSQERLRIESMERKLSLVEEKMDR